MRVHDGLGLQVVIPEDRTRAVAASTEQGMQRLRSQRELEAGCTYGPAKLLINALANIKIRSWEADGGDDEGDGSAADEVPKASPMQFNEIAHS